MLVLSILLHIGNFKSIHIILGNTMKFDLMRTVLPAFERVRVFQPARL